LAVRYTYLAIHKVCRFCLSTFLVLKSNVCGFWMHRTRVRCALNRCPDEDGRNVYVNVTVTSSWPTQETWSGGVIKKKKKRRPLIRHLTRLFYRYRGAHRKKKLNVETVPMYSVCNKCNTRLYIPRCVEHGTKHYSPPQTLYCPPPPEYKYFKRSVYSNWPLFCLGCSKNKYWTFKVWNDCV
jgi:hypothetical protein